MKQMHCMLAALAALCGFGGAAQAAPADFMGKYKGTLTQGPTQTLPCAATVVAEGKGYYRVAIDAAHPAGNTDRTSVEIFGVEQGSVVNLFGRSGGRNWSGTIRDGKIEAGNGYYGMGVELEREALSSPTVGTPPPPGAIVLFPYQEGVPTQLGEWTNQDWELQPDGSVLVKEGDSQTVRPLGDVKLHVEFKVPLMAEAEGQARGNSGVIFCGAYEIQVLDSFGVYPSVADAGSIYNQVAARVNAALPPGEWQAYDIEFRATRFNPDGTVKELPRFVSVEWNGVKIHDNVELPTPTASAKLPHVGPGPLTLQDHRDPVMYRNVWAVELK